MTPIASVRLGAPAEGAEALPPAWFACGDTYFYADLIAYHAPVGEALLPVSPQSFVQCYQLQAARCASNLVGHSDVVGPPCSASSA